MRISDWSSDVCSSDLSRDGSIALTPPSTGPLSKIFSASDIGSSGSNAFTGKGAAPQSNALNGEITVTIAATYPNGTRSEEHTSELQSLMRISYAVFCLKKKKIKEKLALITTLQHYYSDTQTPYRKRN